VPNNKWRRNETIPLHFIHKGGAMNAANVFAILIFTYTNTQTHTYTHTHTHTYIYII
jgi:hypothetical protein